jgi:hypothetical protein
VQLRSWGVTSVFDLQKLVLVAPRAQAQGFEKGLSGDVLAMFHEAQRNILELNKSRLMALDELRQARERIEELGTRLCNRKPCVGGSDA